MTMTTRSLTSTVAFLLLVTSATASSNSATMQVYHDCSHSVYCKYFALTGKSTPWEEIPIHTIKSFDYPTAEYNATLWCAEEPSEQSYSWMKLALEQDTVDYYAGNYGETGISTSQFLDDSNIGPVEQNTSTNLADATDATCQNIECDTSEGCARAASCNQDSTIRWNICSKEDKSTSGSNSELAPLRTIRFVA